jgi:hypothetical protein
MILFALRCAADHEFEGWFRDGAMFDKQSAGGKITCPQCGNNDVTKAPMAPRVARSRKAEATPSPAQLRTALQELRRHVETNCDYVESDPRGIYGETSAEDAAGLADEGIEVSRIPWLPRSDA